jgi:hypothetical protein
LHPGQWMRAPSRPTTTAIRPVHRGHFVLDIDMRKPDAPGRPKMKCPDGGHHGSEPTLYRQATILYHWSGVVGEGGRGSGFFGPLRKSMSAVAARLTAWHSPAVHGHGCDQKGRGNRLRIRLRGQSSDRATGRFSGGFSSGVGTTGSGG